jgi:maltose alpha-D-glucosyltransferase/alpha-amylase
VIDDEVYGYQQVNVTAQRADPNSLFNWTKRLVHLRKAHPVFGRGDFRFLSPENAHVLAYKRTYENETVLIICNLTDTEQTTTLDLSAYSGATPVDLLTDERLSPISAEPYALGLPPYGYRWLALKA